MLRRILPMRTPIVLATAAVLTSSLAQAHFQLLYTPEVMLDQPSELDFKLVFGHPMENGHAMDMGEPEDFFVVFKGEKTDLKDRLKPITWQGAHNEAKAYEASYKIRRNGDYAVVLVPAPYYEESEDIYIQQITKAIINKGAMPTGWNQPLGLKTEIVPLNKPYQAYAGGSFTGRLLRNGEPAPGVECEIEYINTEIDMDANAFSAAPLGEVPPSAIVAITDADGEFTFGIPGPGVWGFACLGSGPDTEHAGKELSQDALLWINAGPLKTQ
jgi:cobalt/nickel transport protein